MAVEKKTKLNDAIQKAIDKSYGGIDHEDSSKDVIDHDDHLTEDGSNRDIDSIVDSVNATISGGAGGSNMDGQFDSPDDSKTNHPEADDSAYGVKVASNIDAESDIMKLIDTMTQDDADKTKETLHKEGYDDRASIYTQGMMTFVGIIMGIGLVVTVISMLSSLAWPIPFIGVWNLVIGVFMILYGSLFLLNWRR